MSIIHLQALAQPWRFLSSHFDHGLHSLPLPEAFPPLKTTAAHLQLAPKLPPALQPAASSPSRLHGTLSCPRSQPAFPATTPHRAFCQRLDPTDLACGALHVAQSARSPRLIGQLQLSFLHLPQGYEVMGVELGSSPPNNHVLTQ
ncbi:hypothetical protein T440DRAFT_252602 [Plenodomus tracheiphilus IPT5]|uniref:Uncharacterized protein n=1 Tax=Plenodomus tracheiphilus IPT5 TaxID=1408161 RepID=A0A6A7AS97_9PLEO|nr:hypothetical protein T440DRAFT_252602 [Plenodomus tracheiphilus IPT5]